MKRKLNTSFFNAILPATLFGAVVGILTSVTVNFYKLCAKHILAFSESGYYFMKEHLYLVPIAIALFAVPAFILARIYKEIPNLRGGGIPTSIGILRGMIPFKWLRNVIGVFLLSLASFCIGVPLGNEGPSVQMGTAIGRGCVYSCAKDKKKRAWDRYSMTGGACAGFSVATGAPISGVIFAIEEAHQRISPMILIIASVSVMFATVTTELIAPIFGVSKNLFPSMTLRTLDIRDIWIPVVVGVVVGLFAVLFLTYYRIVFSFFNKKLKKVRHGYKIMLVFTLTLLLGLVSYSFISTGHHLILELFEDKLPWISLLILLIIRSTLTLCANSNRITGGIFLPILAIGALVSSLIGKAIVSLLALDESYYVIIMVLGIVACISGMMKMPLTAIVFSVEALSCYGNIMPVIVVSGVAFLITELFCVESINDRVLDNLIAEINNGKTTTLVDRYVTAREGSFAIGKQVRDVFWPARLIVLSKKRPADLPHVDEHDAKQIHVGDVLHIRCETFDEHSLNNDLDAILGDEL